MSEIEREQLREEWADGGEFGDIFRRAILLIVDRGGAKPEAVLAALGVTMHKLPFRISFN